MSRLLLVLGVMAAVAPLRAQTDYYNTDAGRPVQIEDAYAIERRAFELQVAPVRFSRARGGVYSWGLEPELSYGFAPRTQVELGLPVAYLERPGRRGAAGISGLDLSVLYNLNTETRVPALAVVGDVLVPVGRFGPSKAYPSVKGIVTRTFAAVRVHMNAQYTFGERITPATAPAGVVTGQGVELSRWLAGAAIDRTMALLSILMTAELFARRPLDTVDDIEWNAGIGARYQLAPRWALDAGVGRNLTGNSQAWYVTAGGAYAIGLPWSAR